MILLTGLGNPGQQYTNTRHNIGFCIANKIEWLGGKFFSGFSAVSGSAREFKGELFKGKLTLKEWLFLLKNYPLNTTNSKDLEVLQNLINALLRLSDKIFTPSSGDVDFLLLRPLTFMNKSGDSIVAVQNFYKVSNTLVIYDDMDISFGELKLKYGGGNAGHNGLKSIESLSKAPYYKLRFGIEKPQVSKSANPSIISWVLSPFSKEQLEALPPLVDRAALIALFIGLLLENFSNSKEVIEAYNQLRSLLYQKPKNTPKATKEE